MEGNAKADGGIKKYSFQGRIWSDLAGFGRRADGGKAKVQGPKCFLENIPSCFTPCSPSTTSPRPSPPFHGGEGDGKLVGFSSACPKSSLCTERVRMFQHGDAAWAYKKGQDDDSPDISSFPFSFSLSPSFAGSFIACASMADQLTRMGDEMVNSHSLNKNYLFAFPLGVHIPVT
jgi:hypothetical protein